MSAIRIIYSIFRNDTITLDFDKDEKIYQQL
jgi:hypothetical protein